MNSSMGAILKGNVIIAISLLFYVPASAHAKLTDLVARIQPAVATVVAFDIEKKVTSIGSGFFINRKGHLITNHHVIVGKFSVIVKTADGQKYPVKAVIAENEPADLVKLAVDIPKSAVKWVRVSDELPAIAEEIIVVGSPLGLEQTVSVGIISAIRNLPNGEKYFQLSAPISQGSSGSPVINLNGNVVGVVSFQSLLGQNLNFAVASRGILNLNDDLPGKPISQWTFDFNRRRPKLAQDICRQGFTFALDGKYEEALYYYRKATEVDPQDPMAWYGLSNCYDGLERHTEAIDSYKKAIHNNPEDEKIHYQLGNYYTKLGRLKDAKQAYLEAIRVNPDFAPAHFHIGITCSKLGLYREALTALQETLRIQPDFVPAHFNIGNILNKMGKPNEAIVAYKKTVKFDPDFYHAYNEMGALYSNLGKYQEGLSALKAALRIAPDDAQAHYNIGYIYAQVGNRLEALEEYKILQRLDAQKAQALFNQIYK